MYPSLLSEIEKVWHSSEKDMGFKIWSVKMENMPSYDEGKTPVEIYVRKIAEVAL